MAPLKDKPTSAARKKVTLALNYISLQSHSKRQNRDTLDFLWKFLLFRINIWDSSTVEKSNNIETKPILKHKSIFVSLLQIQTINSRHQFLK